MLTDEFMNESMKVMNRFATNQRLYAHPEKCHGDARHDLQVSSILGYRVSRRTRVRVS